MIRRLAFALTAAATLAPAEADAFELDYVDGRVGTLGYGGEVGVSVLPGLSVRGVVNGGEFSFDEDLDGGSYDGDVKFRSYGAIADLKPFPLLPFYVSGGAFYNDNEVEARARPTPSQFGSGDDNFTAAQIGVLNADFAFDDFAPYVGVGSRFTLIKIQIYGEVGAYFQGAPQLRLTSNGTLSNDPSALGQEFRRELENERQSVQDDLDNFEVYPVVNVGARYKF